MVFWIVLSLPIKYGNVMGCYVNFATGDINADIIISWAHRQLATRVHKLFFVHSNVYATRAIDDTCVMQC